jgi:hypothetical protein
LRTVPLAFLLLSRLVLFAQPVRDSSTFVLHTWVDGPLVLGTAAAAFGGALVMRQQEPLSTELVYSLDRSSVPAFDRRSFHIDLDEQLEARYSSDIVLGTSMIAPFLLALDKRVRREWGPLITLYSETMLINSSVQTWTAIGVGRYRPIAYLPEASLSQRTDPANHNSFFSGHTSSTATATFFMARIMDDLHPELGGKRWLLYAGAAVPPALAGWYRIRAGKHFPSDVVTGFVFGAAVGMLVPELHRRTHAHGLSFLPWLSPQGIGCSASMQW